MTTKLNAGIHLHTGEGASDESQHVCPCCLPRLVAASIAFPSCAFLLQAHFQPLRSICRPGPLEHLPQPLSTNTAASPAHHEVVQLDVSVGDAHRAGPADSPNHLQGRIREAGAAACVVALGIFRPAEEACSNWH